MKVPLSDDDDDDDDEAAPAKSAAAPAAGGKTFMSDVDLEELKPVANPPPAKPASSGASAPSMSRRAQEERALAAAEASMKYRPRAEWSTETPGDRISTEVFCTTWSPDSKFLAAGCGDGSIRVFNAATGRIAYMLRSSAAAALGSNSSGASGVDESLPITCIRFRPEAAGSKGVLLATSADGSVTHWHVTSQACLYSQVEEQHNVGGGDAQVYSCDYAKDGDHFATGGRDGHVRLYDEATKALVSSLTAGKDKGTTGHSNRVYSVRWHPRDDNVLVSGGWDNTIQVWDTRAGYSVRSIYGPHICGDALDLSPTDGNTILTGSWRPHECLQRWDLASGKLIDTVPFAAGPGGLGADRPELLYAAAYHPDGTSFAAGGCGTNEAKWFSNEPPAVQGTGGPKMLERVSVGNGGVYAMAFAPSGKKLAMGGGGKTITVVDL